MPRFLCFLVLCAVVPGLLVGCQPPPAVLTGPTLVVLSDALPTAPVPAIPFHSDSALAGTPPLFLHLRPGLDTAGVPWLRQLARLPTAPWQVDFMRHGRLRGQPVRYVRRERFWPWPLDSAVLPTRHWPGYHIALTYPELPPGLGPPGANEKLREICYEDYAELLYLWLPPQPAYHALPPAQRRLITDTVLLFRCRPIQLGLLRLPDGRELLSLIKERRDCDSAKSYYDGILYTSWAGHDDIGRAHYTYLTYVFQPALARVVNEAVLGLVRDTRRRHRLPPLTARQLATFHREFSTYSSVDFTPHGVLFDFDPNHSDRADSYPLRDVLPATAAHHVQLLLPYRVVAPYARAPR